MIFQVFPKHQGKRSLFHLVKILGRLFHVAAVRLNSLEHFLVRRSNSSYPEYLQLLFVVSPQTINVGLKPELNVSFVQLPVSLDVLTQQHVLHVRELDEVVEGDHVHVCQVFVLIRLHVIRERPVFLFLHDASQNYHENCDLCKQILDEYRCDVLLFALFELVKVGIRTLKRVWLQRLVPYQAQRILVLVRRHLLLGVFDVVLLFYHIILIKFVLQVRDWEILLALLLVLLGTLIYLILNLLNILLGPYVHVF